METTRMLKLYVNSDYTSPYALSAFVALREKQLSHEIIEVDLNKNAHLEIGYAKQSLTSRIPMLAHDAFMLSESSAICEYLEDAFPDTARIYPLDAQARARARQVQAFVRSDLMPIRVERSTAVVFQRQTPQPLSAEAKKAVTKLFQFADALIGDASEPLFGQWCIADTDLAMMLNRLVHAGDDVPEKLVNYVRAQWSRPSVAEWVAWARKANP